MNDSMVSIIDLESVKPPILGCFGMPGIFKMLKSGWTLISLWLSICYEFLNRVTICVPLKVFGGSGDEVTHEPFFWGGGDFGMLWDAF